MEFPKVYQCATDQEAPNGIPGVIQTPSRIDSDRKIFLVIFATIFIGHVEFILGNFNIEWINLAKDWTSCCSKELITDLFNVTKHQSIDDNEIKGLRESLKKLFEQTTISINLPIKEYFRLNQDRPLFDVLCGSISIGPIKGICSIDTALQFDLHEKKEDDQSIDTIIRSNLNQEDTVEDQAPTQRHSVPNEAQTNEVQGQEKPTRLERTTETNVMNIVKEVQVQDQREQSSNPKQIQEAQGTVETLAPKETRKRKHPVNYRRIYPNLGKIENQVNWKGCQHEGECIHGSCLCLKDKTLCRVSYKCHSTCRHRLCCFYKNKCSFFYPCKSFEHYCGETCVCQNLYCLSNTSYQQPPPTIEVKKLTILNAEDNLFNRSFISPNTFID